MTSSTQQSGTISLQLSFKPNAPHLHLANETINLFETDAPSPFDLCCSGEWRMNRMMDDYQEMKDLEAPKLSHVTSLEFHAMEDHGKHLAEAYIDYVTDLEKAYSPEETAGPSSTKELSQ